MNYPIIIIRTFHILIVCLLALNLFSQEQKVKLYTHVGVTYSNMTGKGVSENSWLNGAPPDCYTNYSAGSLFIYGKTMGLGINYNLNKTFSLESGLEYTEKGCRIPLTWFNYLAIDSAGFYYLAHQTINNNVSNIRIKYLVLPVKAGIHYKFLYFQTGLYCGFRLDADDYGRIDVNGEKVRFERDKDHRYSLFDIGYLVEIGAKIKSIKLGIAGNWNLTGTESHQMDGGAGPQFFNQTFVFKVSFETSVIFNSGRRKTELP